jgi:hypothetical protein
VSITNELKARVDNTGSMDEAVARSAIGLAEYLVSQAQVHLKQIITQHPGFDLHDETHSAAVVNNMEALLGEPGIKARSVFELFLLITSAYLHDCAMAVPEWELNLFRLTEGASSSETNHDTGVKNDLKATISFEVARQLVQSNSQSIYKSFNETRKWMFSAQTEKTFVDDLAKRLMAYQDFRNGFAAELRDLVGNIIKYQERSEQLRQDFIRQTHWLRIEAWIRNLDTLFEERLGGSWGKALAHDLAAICRSHGEGSEFIYGLPVHVVYHGASQSNLRLVALLLRLSDVIHFTPDRAPLILFRQRQISSPISRQHWEVKNQGVDYSIGDSSDGKRTVRYSAYFQTPQLYFAFQEYLDSADREFALYNEIICHGAQTTSETENQLLPALGLQVDRTAIRYDTARFQPIPGLRFSLNQRRILELLMGVKLYKNRFACFRELYQNALDACRCVLAAQGAEHFAGTIEFGIGTGETPEDSYIYCRDNGIGMTKEIVRRYLLQIGDSFYRSSEFQRLVTSWKRPFTPVSQFGVGILSCFIIGKRLEVVSKPLPSMAKTNDAICFMIDGPHEHFYYKPPDIADVETIGAHGTLVKVFLNDSDRKILNDSSTLDIHFLQYAANHINPDSRFAAEAKIWETHLYKHIASFVAQCPAGIHVHVRLADGKSVELLPATAPFNYHTLGVSRAKIEAHEASKLRFSLGSQKHESYLTVVDQVETKEVKIETEGVFFSCIVNFPKPGFDGSIRALALVGAIGLDSGVLVNGITVEKGSPPYTMGLTDSLARVGVLNFTGRHCPVLSVDRMSIIEWPKDVEQLVLPIERQLTLELIRAVASHSSEYGFDAASYESSLIWEYVFTRFGFLASSLIKTIVEQSEVTVPHRELAFVTSQTLSIRRFSEIESVVIRFANYHTLAQSTKLLLYAKLAGAQEICVEGSTITVRAGTFAPINNCRDWDHFRERQYVFCSDMWTGMFEKFDVVSSIWPVIPSRLFEQMLGRRGESVQINDRTKCVYFFSNSLGAISQLDPLLIHQRLGIYGIKSPSFGEAKPISNVYRFEEARNNFWLHEIGWEWEKPVSERKNYLLIAYIAPRTLTGQEELDLARYKSEDPEYVKGVQQGWSLLILGNKDLNAICIPGVVSRQELLNAVPKSFWLAHKEDRFEFLDGTKPILAPPD